MYRRYDYTKQKTVVKYTQEDDVKRKFSMWVHVNIPFAMLREGYLERFLAAELNPEIGLDGNVLDSCSPADFKYVAEQLHTGGLAVTLHGPFIDLSAGSPDPMVRAVTRRRFEQMLQVISFFRPKSVVCHGGYDEKRHHYFGKYWVEESIELWSWLGSRVRDEGSVLLLENVYEKNPQEMGALLEGLRGAGVGLCLDVGHHAAFSRTPLEVWLESLATFLRQLHLHDNRGLQDEHLPLGGGNVNFEELFRLLVKMGIGPLITTLEPHREEDLDPSVEYLEKVWPW
jgi:sugar phosphate isomerase/epimerase